MNLYEINEELEKAFAKAVDQETGEIDENAMAYFDELTLQKEVKQENIALFIKNLKADYEALKKEKQSFEARMRSTENKLNWLKSYLADSLDGEKFKTTKVNCYFTHTKSIELNEGTDIGDLLPVYIRMAEPELNKTAVKEALARGEVVEGVHEVENVSLVIR